MFKEIYNMISGYNSSAAHRSIANFSWRGIATTNYDKLIEQGYIDNPDRKQNYVPFVKNIEPYEDRSAATSRHGVSAANPACEVSNIAIVDGETLKPEEKYHETLRWN